MESLSRIRFNHEAEMFYEAIGVPEGDAENVTARVGEIAEATTSVSAAVEMIVSEFSGGHLAYALIRLGHLMAGMRGPADFLRELLGPAEDCDCPDCRRARGEL